MARVQFGSSLFGLALENCVALLEVRKMEPSWIMIVLANSVGQLEANLREDSKMGKDSVRILEYRDGTAPRGIFRIVREQGADGVPWPVRDVIGVVKMVEVFRSGFGFSAQDSAERVSSLRKGGELTFSIGRLTEQQREIVRL